MKAITGETGLISMEAAVAQLPQLKLIKFNSNLRKTLLTLSTLRLNNSNSNHKPQAVYSIWVSMSQLNNSSLLIMDSNLWASRPKRQSRSLNNNPKVEILSAISWQATGSNPNNQHKTKCQWE
jgi:hypothetical protein